MVEPRAPPKELYERFRTEMRSEVLRDGYLVEDNAEDMLKRLLRLVQVASNPRLVDDAYDGVPGQVSTAAISGGGGCCRWFENRRVDELRR